MSHHDKITHVEVIFLDRRGKYFPGQIVTLPVDNWLLSLFRGKPSIEIVNPSHLVFNKNATGLHDIWEEPAPKPEKIEKPYEEKKAYDNAKKFIAESVAESKKTEEASLPSSESE